MLEPRSRSRFTVDRLCAGAKIVGIALGHVTQALNLLATAHGLLAGVTIKAANQQSDAASRDDAPGQEAELMMAVVEVTLMESLLAQHSGDYEGAYDKQSCAIELLSVLAQSTQPAAADTSRRPALAGEQKNGESAPGKPCADVSLFETRLTGAIFLSLKRF